MDQAVNELDQAVSAGRQGVFEFHGSSPPADHDLEKAKALELVHDAVVVTDARGYVTYLNRAATRLYGWNAADVVGCLARTVLHCHDLDSFDEAWHMLRTSGEWRGQITQQTKHGLECLVESRWSEVRAKGQVNSIVMVSTDLTRINEATAGLAHEIRNPLAGIKGVADVLLDRSKLSVQEREWVEAVRREVLKIDGRLRELLDLSRPRAASITECSLNDLIRGVVLLASHQVERFNGRQGRVALEFIDTAEVPLHVCLEPARIEDAVLNLVLNAIESINTNGIVTVRLSRAAKSNGAEALIEVSDTGCGIPVENRQRIFEPQFTTKREGTGLGLAAVRRTAAACHGRITFKTRLGYGSKFVLALPLRS